MDSLLSVHQGMDDHRLIERVADVVGVPRAEVTGNESFVLHAPLELLARAALLPLVRSESYNRARARIAVLADLYEDSGPPRPAQPPAEFDSIADAADALAVAISDGDADSTDVAAAWLSSHARPDQLTALLSGVLLPNLEAAGHANIYLALLGRSRTRGLPDLMLRHPANALVSRCPRRITVPATTTVADPHGEVLGDLLDTIRSTRPIGPASGYGIAAMVEHAEDHRVFDPLAGEGGGFRSPQHPPFALLRFAAHAMLQGPAEQAPYGWTHCLTLAQAPLLTTGSGADAGTATYVAAAYLAAHWAALGEGAVDLDFVPEPPAVDLDEALHSGPDAAAAAAWHTAPSEVTTTLATLASSNHDAHRVKYTLACLDAAARDRPATRLYLAAAAYLNAWWQTTGDDTDPMPHLASEARSDGQDAASRW